MTEKGATEPQLKRARPWLIWVAPALVSLMVGVLLAGLLPGTPSAPTPSAASSSTPLGFPPCTAADVSAESNFEGATGSLAGGITITNAGMASCVLSGPPLEVELRSGGRVLDVALTTYDSLLADRPAPAPPVLLGRGDRALSFVQWSNWCGGGLSSLEMLVVLPDGSGPIVTAPEPIGSTGPAATPRCDDAAAPSALGAFAFAPFPR